MTFYWKKLGRLFNPAAHKLDTKLLTHAANPLPIHLYDDVYRIFYSGRDLNNCSSVGAVDINIITHELVHVFEYPFITPGDCLSDFCNAGISIGNCYSVGGQKYILFMGWQNNPGQHWRGTIGRLRITDASKIVFDPIGPFFTIDKQDPLSLSYPWIQESPSGGFDMWYGSTITWDAGNGEMIHVINHASSSDGYEWFKSGLAVPFEIGVAQAFSHPTVYRNSDETLLMWFSYRSGTGQKYRIGLASFCPIQAKWTLDLHNSGITTSNFGWDSEMVAYPYVFEHKGFRYMLYNGNGYGKSGFGLAVHLTK